MWGQQQIHSSGGKRRVIAKCILRGDPPAAITGDFLCHYCGRAADRAGPRGNHRGLRVKCRTVEAYYFRAYAACFRSRPGRSSLVTPTRRPHSDSHGGWRLHPRATIPNTRGQWQAAPTQSPDVLRHLGVTSRRHRKSFDFGSRLMTLRARSRNARARVERAVATAQCFDAGAWSNRARYNRKRTLLALQT